MFYEVVLINNQFANLSDFINLSFDQPSSSAFSQTLWRLYELSVLQGRIDLHFFCRSVLQYKSVLNWTLLTVKVYETDFSLWFINVNICVLNGQMVQMNVVNPPQTSSAKSKLPTFFSYST